MMHLVFLKYIIICVVVKRKISEICTIFYRFFLPKCRAPRVGVMHFINYIYISLQLYILHTEFRRENPSSFTEEAEHVQMLTHDKRLRQRWPNNVCFIL